MIDLDNIPEGYIYYINNGSITMGTGKGGVDMFVNDMRKRGISDNEIRKWIFLYDEEGNKYNFNELYIEQ